MVQIRMVKDIVVTLYLSWLNQLHVGLWFHPWYIDQNISQPESYHIMLIHIIITIQVQHGLSAIWKFICMRKFRIIIEAPGQVHYEFSSANNFHIARNHDWTFYEWKVLFNSGQSTWRVFVSHCIMVHVFFRITKNVDKIYLAIKCLPLISHE